MNAKLFTPTAKRRIAAAARELILPGTTCFLDFGTTAFALAEELRRQPPEDLRVITNNLPAAELLTATPGVRVYLLGGELLPRQSVLLGWRGVRRAALLLHRPGVPERRGRRRGRRLELAESNWSRSSRRS